MAETGTTAADNPDRIYASPDGLPRYFYGRCRTAFRLQEAIEHARPGNEIFLLPGVYDEPVVIRGKDGITLVGDSTTTLDGRRNPVRPPSEYAERTFYAFIKVLESTNIVIDNMAIQNVWPTAIYIENSQQVTVRQMNLNGATHGIFARGEKTHGITIEKCSWIQDERIWGGVNWYDIHEDPNPRKELDGDFFRSHNIKGDVVIRYNFIAQAFNGVHFFGPKRAKPGDFNTNVWIYRNTFTFIRDNAIEAEKTATNWWVFENRIYNCHKWFAFERCNNGHLYVFSNRGWFDRLPGPPGDCNIGGAVFKTNVIGDEDDDVALPAHPVYVFNNSWYVRSTYIKKGKLRHFHHFANAIDYAQMAHHPAGVIQHDRRMIGVGGVDPVCDGPAKPELSFIRDWTKYDICFDNDVCNHPDYPARLCDEGYSVAGTQADPRFASGRIGEFGIEDDSPCFSSAESREVKLISGETWELQAGRNIGAMHKVGEEHVPYTPFDLGCPATALPDDYVDRDG